MDSTLVAETAVTGLVVLGSAPWVLIGLGRLVTPSARTRTKTPPTTNASAGATADVAPAAPAETTPAEQAPLAAVAAPAARVRRGPNPKLSEFASRRPRQGGRFVPTDRAS